jgi:hypothetical protein
MQGYSKVNCHAEALRRSIYRSNKKRISRRGRLEITITPGSLRYPYSAIVIQRSTLEKP